MEAIGETSLEITKKPRRSFEDDRKSVARDGLNRHDVGPTDDEVHDYEQTSPFLSTEKKFYNKEGKEVQTPIVYFDEEAYKNGFTRAWAIVIKPGDTREAVHAAIINALEKVKDDKELKSSLIATYCDIAREDNRVFYNDDALKRSISRVTDALNASDKFREETTKKGPLNRMTLAQEREADYE